jgi:hypothetical protein
MVIKNPQNAGAKPQMKKHRIIKTVIITAAVLVLLECILSVGLVFYAIKSYDGMEDIADAPRVVSDQVKAVTEHNIEEISARTAEWLAQTERREVCITANDGIRLYADQSVSENHHKWVILLHGYKRTREKVYNYGRFYAEQGFNLLMPDLRGHGKSEGAFIGMGWLDRTDICKWAEWIAAQDPDAEIVLHGISMGAAAAMMASGENLCGNVKAVIADSGYTSVWDQFANVTKSYTGLPEFPLMYTASFAAKIMAGYSYAEASALEQVKQSPLPILFIHGGCDTFVYPQMAQQLYAAHPNGALLCIDEAAHAQAMYYSPEYYFENVFSFIDKYIHDSSR